jgi:hypothetical protein
VAHSEQNLAPGRLRKPQLEHAAASGDAHSMQNLALATFWVPQLEQVTSTLVLGWAAASEPANRA